MQIQRNDLIGGACAVLALGLIAWLSLDSWAITRCEEFLATERPEGMPGLSLEQAKCLARHMPAPEAEN
ncbi:MAG: hypothetical protein R3C04_00360 [Hyphomonas sp.]